MSMHKLLVSDCRLLKLRLNFASVNLELLVIWFVTAGKKIKFPDLNEFRFSYEVFDELIDADCTCNVLHDFK